MRAFATLTDPVGIRRRRWGADHDAKIRPAIDGSRSESSNQVCHFCHELVNELLLLAIGVSDPLVLAQMLNPGVKFERFEKTAFLRQILEDLPLESSVPPPLASQSFKRLQKGTAIVRPDLIFHGHQHWPSIGIDVAGKDRSRPVHGWREVESRAGLELPAPQQGDRNQSAKARENMSRRQPAERSDLAPD